MLSVRNSVICISFVSDSGVVVGVVVCLPVLCCVVVEYVGCGWGRECFVFGSPSPGFISGEIYSGIFEVLVIEVC